jgi:uncharacterized protein YndB with AHSA1/START domain
LRFFPYSPPEKKKGIMAERIAFTCEYPMKVRAQLLYSYISTASGLAEWFADDVRVNQKEFTFVWDGSEEKARLARSRRNEHVRFDWIEREEDEYIDFRIQPDDVTGEIALVITDFEEANEVEEARMVLDRTVENLRAIVGRY